uniref:Uncharacterized protein n=1 Tax=Arundo donax TaxID=35708 RepID=A0A0A9C777_ARUDO
MMQRRIRIATDPRMGVTAENTTSSGGRVRTNGQSFLLLATGEGWKEQFRP